MLPVADRAIFAVDFVRAVQASAELGVWNVLAQTVAEWSETAAIQADPELRNELTAPIDVDHGPVPSPEQG